MTTARESRPGGRSQAAKNVSADSYSVPQSADTPRPRLTPTDLPANYLERFTLRLLQDALAQATSGYWERRADELEACRSRPGDWPGAPLDSWAATMARADRAQQRDDRLAADALECRRHAQLFHHHAVSPALVAEALDWPTAGLLMDETLWLAAERKAAEARAAAWA